MNSPSSFRPRIGRVLSPATCLLAMGWMLIAAQGVAQDAPPKPDAPTKPSGTADNISANNIPAKEIAAGGYMPAIELLPDSTAGLVRIPDLPKFCEAFKKTHAGQLFDEPSMQPFIEAQRERAKNYLNSVDNRIGIRPNDLFDIATGEVVFAWLPFEKDKRRPFAFCVVTDTRGAKAKAETAMEQIDKDLKAGGATRKDVTHGGHLVRVYSPQRKPGQLKVEQIAITLSDVRLIAADRDSVVTDLLDAIAGKPKGASISTLPEFKTVLTRSSRAIRGPLTKGGGAIAAEWFARPFQMGRILRETFNVDRGNDVDILKLLENQGFDALKAAGGIAAIAGDRFDLLHQGFVLAPPTTDEPSKYEKAARMLQFVNADLSGIPDWVHPETASFNRLHLRIEEAFWASETLIDEALGDKIFRPMIDGIKKDEDGPQIDIENDVLPNLDNQVILLTDNTVPVTETSERMLVAIRVLDAQKIKEAIRKAMEVEPDTSKLDDVPGVEIWRVQRGEAEVGFDAEAFGDLDLGFEDPAADEPPPLLDHWAIALVDKGPNSEAPYLMFSSHPEFLIATAKRIQEGAAAGLGSLPEIQTVKVAILDLGGKSPAFDRTVRTKLSLRAKYQLLRKGMLKDSDSLMSALYRRMFEGEEGGQPDPLNAAKLPPLTEIEKFLPEGGSFFETTADGWSMTGFLLK